MSVMLRFVLCALFMIFSGVHQAAAGSNETKIVAVVARISGTLRVLSDKQTKWAKGKEGMFVREGDSLWTAKNSKAQICFINGVDLTLNEDSKIVIPFSELSKSISSSSIELRLGRALTKILRKGTKFDVNTPVVTVGIRGTEVETDVESGGLTSITVLTGEVEVRNSYGKQTVKANMRSIVEPGSAPSEPEQIRYEEKPSWHQDKNIQVLGRISLVKQSTDMIVDEPSALKVSVLAADSALPVEYSDTVTLEAGPAALFSGDSGKSWSGTLSIKPSAEFLLKAVEPGEFSVLAGGPGLYGETVKFTARPPQGKEVTIKIRKEDGKEKKFRLRFKRQ